MASFLRIGGNPRVARAKMAFCFVVFCSFAALTSLIPSSTTAEKAQWLVRYHKADTKFELNEDALLKLSHLRKPLKVISAIGEARVGKSTTLNFVRHVLDCEGGKPAAEIEEVFKTGDSWRAVTYGVWMSVCEKQNIVLLDVEGTNLGNEAITSHLSVFTALMSSSIVVFSPESIKNDILNFLHGVTRLSEHIFKGIGERNDFGHLHIVIRNPLSVSGKSFEDAMRDAIVEPSGEDEVTDNTRRAIAKYFHKDNISVSAIPVIANRELLRDSGIKKNNGYWNAILMLSRLFRKTSPHKMTLRGKLIDGATLVEIARTLIKTMNKNVWSDFGDNYVMVEKFLCEKIYHAVFVPILKIETVNEIEQRKESVLKAFKDGCALREEVDKVEDELRRLISTVKEKEEARQREEERRERRRGEERREMEEEDNRRRQRKREEDIKFEGKIEGAIKAVVSTGLAYGVYALYAAFLSDARLKENVIAVIPSKYEALEVQEVTWTWNEEAEKIGLHGEARGVIAQEVEKLYPWAVLTGSDGYKRVLYGALDYALNSMKEAKRKEDKLGNKRDRFPNDEITQKHFLHLI